MIQKNFWLLQQFGGGMPVPEVAPEHLKMELDGQAARVECKISAPKDDSFDLTYPDSTVHHLRRVK